MDSEEVQEVLGTPATSAEDRSTDVGVANIRDIVPARQGRENNRYSEDGQRLTAGCVVIRQVRCSTSLLLHLLEMRFHDLLRERRASHLGEPAADACSVAADWCQQTGIDLWQWLNHMTWAGSGRVA
jgi:hypothetical protein